MSGPPSEPAAPCGRALGVVDRVEGDVVVLDVDGKEEPRPRSDFGPTLEEGDVVDLATGERLVEETARRRESVAELQRRLKDRSPGKPGGFDL